MFDPWSVISLRIDIYAIRGPEWSGKTTIQYPSQASQ
jgi:hypothetical protein